MPPAVIAADPREERERTLLKMIEAAVADPTVPEFDRKQAIDELKQYLWAGTETTALTLAWALYETSQRPEAAERIRQEGEAVYGDREPTAADYSALAYTRAVIQETMRLYPPIWGLIRVATERRRNRRQEDQSRRPRHAVCLWRAPQPEVLAGARNRSCRSAGWPATPRSR